MWTTVPIYDSGSPCPSASYALGEDLSTGGVVVLKRSCSHIRRHEEGLEQTMGISGDNEDEDEAVMQIARRFLT
jgi:hypothetical protein